MRAKIVATGSYVPEKVVAKADLTQFPSNGLQALRSCLDMNCATSIRIWESRQLTAATSSSRRIGS